MGAVSVLPKLGAAVMSVLLLPSAALAAAGGMVVQQIGPQLGSIAEAVAEDAVDAGATIVPLSPDLDARTTPIILAPDTIFVRRNGEQVAGVRPAEQRAIRQAYEAGQVILLLDPSMHDIEALHLLVDDGVASQSSTHPLVLAYALRQENGVPSARLVTHPVVDDDPGDHELALRQAIGIVVEELTRPPVVREDAPAAGGPADWQTTPVQKTILASTDNGTYNTPVEIYALHACTENKDYYLVNTGGDWTATQARWESASMQAGQMSIDSAGTMQVDWQANDDHCQGGIDVFNGDERACRYRNYPLSYQVEILPPSGPTVVQVNAAPAADQGLSSSYSSGFSFSIDGEVEVSGEGPVGGLQAGVSWDNTVSTTVPALTVQAGDAGPGNQGAFTTYKYCTAGTDANCTSTIQMTGASGLCRQFIVGQPQNGQTPDGRLSDVAQTVYWQVDPATYTGSTFDITVTWTVDLAWETVSSLWAGHFHNADGNGWGPMGMCNAFGCSCLISTGTTPTTVSQTFHVPLPSSSQCPSSS